MKLALLLFGELAASLLLPDIVGRVDPRSPDALETETKPEEPLSLSQAGEMWSWWRSCLNP